MLRQFTTICQFHQITQIHNTDTVGNMLYHREIMSDKQIGQPSLLLQIFKHIDDLRLNRYIQCGNRLITDDEFRIYCQRSGNTNSLTLSAGKLMGIAVSMLRIQPYLTEHLNNHIISFLFIGCQMMDINGFSHNIADGHTGIQTCIGILEYNLHFLTIRKHIHRDLFLLVKNHIAIIDDGTIRRFI